MLFCSAWAGVEPVDTGDWSRTESFMGVARAIAVPVAASVADRESLAMMLRLLQLIEQCDGIVFERDRADALRVVQHVILADAVVARARARSQSHRGRQKNPVEMRLLLQQVVELASAADPRFERRIVGRKFRRIEILLARGGPETRRATYRDETRHARFLHRRDDGFVAGDVPLVD